MKKSGNTILITGGGSGIGQQLAWRFHDMGNKVIVAGRTEASLAETAEGRDNIHAMPLDVADPTDIARFAEAVMQQHPGLNVLINNAGMMKYEDNSTSRDLSDAEATVTTNLLGPIRLTDALIDHLTTQDDAVIMNVTSGLGFVPLPGAATYSATKAALHSYSVALRVNLQDKVEVIEIIPPAVQTELTPGQSDREGYMPLDDFIDQVMAQFQDGDPPLEICVPNSAALRNAEKDGSFEEKLAFLTQLSADNEEEIKRAQE